MADPIDTTLRLIDQISAPLKRIANSTEHLINRMERMQRLAGGGLGLNKLASSQKNMQETVAQTANSFQTLTSRAVSSNLAIKKLTDSTGSFNKVLSVQNKVKVEQDKITNSVRQTTQASSNWGSTISSVLASYVGFKTVGGGLSITDEFAQTTARIDNMNDGLQTTADLQQQIYESAQRSRGSYIGMQQAVAKMGLLAQEAFSGNSEVVAFTELVQKSFAVGGASTMEQESGMYQLTQAMAAGKLQGDEFRSIMENAPLIADAIAKSTGKSKGELKDMSAEGVITADIVKNAMFFMADDINKKFENIPKTFGTVAQEIKNYAVNTLTPVMQQLNNMLNSEKGQVAINNIKLAIQSSLPVMTSLINVIGTIGSVFNSIFPYMPAIITSAVVAWGAYYAVTKSQLVIDSAMAIQKGILTAVTWAQTVAVSGLTVAWHALNTAMKANVIILIISAIVALVAWVITLWKTNDEFAIGLLRVWHGILNFFDKIPAFFWTLVEAMMGPFKLWATTIGKLYDVVINGIINGINKVLGLVNKVTGSSYAIEGKFSMENIANEIENWAGDKKAGAQAKASGNAYLRQLELAQFKADRANGSASRSNVDSASGSAHADYANGTMGDIGKVGEVGKIKDKVDISSEDLKTMRELAEMNNIQNYVTLQPTVSFGDMNVRQDGLSIEQIVAKINDNLSDSFNSSARKVFA